MTKAALRVSRVQISNLDKISQYLRITDKVAQIFYAINVSSRLNFAAQRAQPKTLTIQISEVESHLTVTVPSTSLSQKQEPLRFRPQSAFCMMIQLAMNLKFLLTEVMALRIWR